LTENCGNPGCTTCHDVHFRPFLKDGVPHRMPQWMYRTWWLESYDVRRWV
jgi:hypothetical protein